MDITGRSASLYLALISFTGALVRHRSASRSALTAPMGAAWIPNHRHVFLLRASRHAVGGSAVPDEGSWIESGRDGNSPFGVLLVLFARAGTCGMAARSLRTGSRVRRWLLDLD